MNGKAKQTPSIQPAGAPVPLPGGSQGAPPQLPAGTPEQPQFAPTHLVPLSPQRGIVPVQDDNRQQDDQWQQQESGWSWSSGMPPWWPPVPPPPYFWYPPPLPPWVYWYPVAPPEKLVDKTVFTESFILGLICGFIGICLVAGFFLLLV
jgi:hypothetical protein